MKPLRVKLLFGSLSLALLTLAAGNAAAQLYKWVGPDGKVNYTDTPPPKNAAKVENKNLKGIGSVDANLPFELAEATRNHPITLFTTAQCAPCDAARNYLKTRGIPFTEKTVNTHEDQTKFKQVSSGSEFPLVLIGNKEVRGFEAGAWNGEMTAAGYPEKNILPKGYQYRKAEPAAPVAPKPTPTPTPARTEPEAVKPAPVENKNPGFQF